ncbi:hypothetical protein [Nonomuraea sp. NPDC050786]|uniref:hypothetical protein n=1 Tax=Nonomuraea sp. NPDC050786 TaxID=3154840 RepID=UPI0033E903B2
MGRAGHPGRHAPGDLDIAAGLVEVAAGLGAAPSEEAVVRLDGISRVGLGPMDGSFFHLVPR